METLPLHPGLVHLPLGIVFILPILSLLFLFFLKKTFLNRNAFIFLVILHGLLCATSFVAMETGEDEEDKVEKIVEEYHIEEHEQKAEDFLISTIVVFIFTLIIYFIPNINFFIGGSLFLLILQFALIFMAYEVGHTGGELVYKYKAADSYIIDYSNEDQEE